MHKQIVIKVPLHCGKCKTRAMTVAAVEGVLSLAFEGDQLIVVGEGVDAACLAVRLRKKMGYAEIVSVGQVDEKNPPTENNDNKVKEREKIPMDCFCRNQSPAVIVFDNYPSSCLIM